MELDGGGGHDEPSRTFPLYEARLHSLRGLLHSLVADAPFREQRAHEVGGKLPAYSSCLIDDQEAMLYGLLGVGQGTFAHGREGVVGTRRDEGEHTLHHMALAAARGSLQGDADRPLQQTRCHSEVAVSLSSLLQRRQTELTRRRISPVCSVHLPAPCTAPTPLEMLLGPPPSQVGSRVWHPLGQPRTSP